VEEALAQEVAEGVDAADTVFTEAVDEAE